MDTAVVNICVGQEEDSWDEEEVVQALSFFVVLPSPGR
jgi:hypothetical protein